MELENSFHFDDKNKIEWARKLFESKQHKFKNRSFQQIRRRIDLKQFERFLIWTSSLKNIESNYGYTHYVFFRFIRGLFHFSLITGILIIIFIVIPQITYPASHRYVNAIEPLENCKNFSDRNILTADNYQALATECCTKIYESYIEELVSQEDTFQIFIDILQGTGFMEDTFLFYGYYNNRTTNETDKDHVYFMGMAFIGVAIIAFFYSSIKILKQIAISFKTIIIRTANPQKTVISQKVFATWDFRISDVVQAKAYKEALSTELMKCAKKKEKQKNDRNILRIIIRLITFSLTVAFLGGAGYGIYELYNQIMFLNEKNEYIRLLYGFLPGLALTFLNFIFPKFCLLIERFEKYKNELKYTIYLFRTGLVRLGSVVFLLISLSITIFRNKGFCSSQSESPISSFFNENFEEQTKSIKCWETYVGQQLYRLVVLDFITKLLVTFFYELPASLFISEKSIFSFLRPIFNLDLQFLDLIYLQTIIWSSIFFAPGLIIISIIYYFLTFYIRKFSLYYCNTSKEKKLESLSSLAIYLVLLFAFLFSLLIFGLVISNVQPSRSCGPFRLHDSDKFLIINKIEGLISNSSSNIVKTIFEFVFSYVFVFSVILVLVVSIWVMYSYSRSYIELRRVLGKIIHQESQNNAFLAKKLVKIKSLQDELTTD